MAMLRLIFSVFIIFSIIIANPLFTDVINEFQTDTILGQKFEFHPLNWGSEIPLLNTSVTTPGGTSYIDTSITNPPYGYTIIDTSILNGPFYLPLTTGYITAYLQDYFLDEISYADTFHSTILAPPMGASASRFFYIVYFNEPQIDWYIDYTPTFGSENDDYPGCVICGYVYLNNIPVENAKVTANLIDSIQTPGPFYKACTTYTDNNGFYHFDSLWSLRYWMTASIFNGPPQGELAPKLCALWPTNLNFNFVGTEENLTLKSNLEPQLFIYPNPFRNHCEIKSQIPSTKSQTNSNNQLNPKSQTPNHSTIRNSQSAISLRIYDATGRLVRQFNHLTIQPSNHLTTVVWQGDDDLGRKLPAGVYIVRLEAGDFKKVEKIVLLK